MALFNRSHTGSYWRSIVGLTMVLFSIISEIMRYIGRKSRFFHTIKLHSTLQLGGSRQNIAVRFSKEKLECCGYPNVKKVPHLLYTQYVNVTERRTDGQADTARQRRSRLCRYRAAKTMKVVHFRAFLQYDTVYLTCSKSWRVASLVHHTEQTKKLKKQEVKVIWQKAPHGAHSPVRGHPRGRNLYHWIPGVGVPISVP